MRSSRAVREGSTGLLILGGIGLLVALGMWIRGINPGSRSYRIVVEFEDAQGIILGTTVRYRGMPVGKVVQVKQGKSGVDVYIDISSGSLVIPADASVASNQSGLVSSSYIDFTPKGEISDQALAMNPHSKDCSSTVIICDGARLKGGQGSSIDKLIQVSSRLAERLDDEELFSSLQQVAKNSSSALEGVTKLTQELTTLTKVASRELESLSGSAKQTTASLNRTLDQATITAERFSMTADQLTLTAGQVSSLLEANRSTLILTLDNLNQTTRQLRIAMTEITPVISRVSQGELLTNLEALSANTAEASANLRDVTHLLNSPSNLLILQQTLDSARSTFQNVEKITSDLDSLTGDPQLRENLRRVINGLSGLVSSTQQLEQQTHLAQVLTNLADATDAQATPSNPNDRIVLSIKPLPVPSQLTNNPTPLNSSSPFR